MAFFSSKSYDQDEHCLRRSISTERLKQRQPLRSRSASAQCSETVPPVPSSSSSSSAVPHKRYPSKRDDNQPRVTAVRHPQHQSRSLPTAEDNALHKSTAPKFPRRERSEPVSQSHQQPTSAGPASRGAAPGLHPHGPYSYIDDKITSSPISVSPSASLLSPLSPPTRPYSRNGSKSSSPHRGEYPSPIHAHHSQLPPSAGARERHKSSGNTSDGSMSYLRSSSPLDMKRLLSKPAQPSSGSILSNSACSDSERSPRLLIGQQQRTPATASSSQSGEFSDHRSRLSYEATGPIPRGQQGSTSRHSQRHWKSESEREKVAIRAGAWGHSSSLQVSRDMPTSRAERERRERSSKYHGSIDVHHGNAHKLSSSPLMTTARNDSHTNHVTEFRRPSPSHSAQTRLTDTPTPPGLTPAGAVVHAYKQQEERRSLLEEGDEKAGTPYYTVFGNPSGRVVAVGSPQDGYWDQYFSEPERSPGGARPASRLRRKLSRKASGKIKKETGKGEQGVGGTQGHSEVYDGTKGRTSVQERRSVTLPRERRKSLKLSIDGFVDVDGVGAKAALNGAPAKFPVTDRAWGDDKGEFCLTGPLNAARGEGKKDDSSPTGKFWKLMKRLSSGALKEGYNRSPSADPPPPVPAIPQNLLSSPRLRNTSERSNASAEADRWAETGVLSRFMQSRPSLTVGRPSTAPQQTSPTQPFPSTTPSAFHRQHRIPSNNSGGTGPSYTTRSSSSDMASTQFFNRTHSARSSTSSYGELMPPPVPNRLVGQYIIPPEELHRLGKQNEEDLSFSLPTAYSLPKTSEHLHISLPTPPRRSTNGTGAKGDTSLNASPDSPMIPTFSTESPANAFGPRPRGQLGRNSPSPPPPSLFYMPTPDSGRPATTSERPPRPPRDARRMTSATVTHKSAGSSPKTSPSSTSLEEPSQDSENDRRSAAKGDRMSSGTVSQASTARGWRRTSFGTFRTMSEQSNTPLTFREMNEASRNAWTEQEKAAKWDDLLERSAKAGGTLHVGINGLLSDHVRDLEYSEFNV